MPRDEGQQQTAKPQWLRLGLLLLGGLSGLWVLTGRFLIPTTLSFPNTPFTTLLFLAGAATKTGIPGRYRWSIVAGLGFSAAGDAFLMHPKDFFLAGLGSFLAAHLCYLWALTSDSRPAGRKLPFALWAGMGFLLVALLWPGVPRALRIPVVLYTATLLVMASQASSRALSRRERGAVVAAVGAALFVISDSVLAFQRFRHPLEWGRVMVLSTYFAAQAGMALSVLLYREPAGRPRPAVATPRLVKELRK